MRELLAAIRARDAERARAIRAETDETIIRVLRNHYVFKLQTFFFAFLEKLCYFYIVRFYRRTLPGRLLIGAGQRNGFRLYLIDKGCYM